MRRLILPLILLVALIFRVLWITQVPIGFNADEASFGYDAYSILKTGKDQWGNFMPLVLKSFGDYKSPLYSYLDIPFVAALGLNKFAVRLPAAILGTLAVLAVYLLVKQETKKELIALTSAFLLAVSPWHVMLSRGAYEANLITLFVPLGIYLFLRGKYNLSAVAFGLSLFTYHSAKLIAPLVFVFLFLYFKPKKALTSLLTFSAFFLVLAYTFTIGGGSRIAERSITAGALEEGAKVKIELIQKGVNPTLARALHNKYQVMAGRFISNYSQYFSGRFLFSQGAGESTYGMAPGVGVTYPFAGIFLLGIIPLLLDEKEKRLKITTGLVVVWLLIAPLPAALATGVGYSGNRAAGMIAPLVILEAVGLFGWVSLFKNYGSAFTVQRSLAALAGIAFVFFSLFEIIGFAKFYFLDSNKIMQRGMLYGSLEAANWLKENSIEKTVVVSRSLSETQIFIAFANSWNPGDYQMWSRGWNLESYNVAWVDQLPNYRLGSYVFQEVDWRKNTGKPNSLLVGRPEDFSKDVNPAKVIKYPDGTDAVYIVDTNEQIYANAF